MRNLKLLVNLEHSVHTISNSQKFVIGNVDYNCNFFKRKGTGFIYKDGEVYTLSPVDGTSSLLVSLKQLTNERTHPVALFYNSVLNSLNIALENGEVWSVLLGEDLTSPENETQCVGSIGTGLQNVALSPDTETVVFLTGDNVIILMSGNFDPIEETELFGSDRGEQEMVNVGWGKKETQFHGSEGKAAAKKNLSSEENTKPTLNEDQSPYITWRGDSTLFAINYYCLENNYRKVKIFDKSGHLQCTSELLPGLGSLLSWRPSGNLIALTQRLPNKHVICFMEKNGLRHGDFTLPQNIKVLDLSWNLESTILSAVCVDEAVNQSCILLFTTGNYHWYLKQRLNLVARVVALCWDDVIGNLAHILLEDGSYLVYQWAWSVDHSAGMVDKDLAMVAVIDGCDVKLSAFKKCIIPPPMCGATISLPCPALQIMFSSSCGHISSEERFSPNDFCVYLSDGRLALVKDVESTPQLSNIVPIHWKCDDIPVASPASFSHWLWISHDQLICVINNGSSHLCLVQLDNNAATVVSTNLLEEAVLTVSNKTGSPAAVIQLSSGSLLVYQDGCLTPSINLPEPCVAVSCMGDHTFARAYNNHFYVDGELESSNVTSFFCLPKFLVMTMSNHQLVVASAESGFKVQNENETSRKLERGSRLVMVVGHSVVLQLPRGNLETVEPRALTLVTAARLLDSGDYKAVAQLLRRQRINLNLCVDHNPSVFLLSVPRFVAQVRDSQWLSVFLAELSDEDVTRGMYAGYYKHLTGRGPPLSDKVQRVCAALREAMTQTDAEKEFFLQPILSTYVREGRVGEAIQMADSDQALNYLILLIDTDRLYEEALGVYNLDKALKIAGKSLKDPKEYVTYLNELHGMDPAYMRFILDKRLRKPQSALRNLAQCPDRIEECMAFIQQTGLYNLALELFKEQPDTYRRVCLLFGGHLQEKQSYQEASIMFSRAGEITKAVSVLTKAGCWQQCLTLVAKNNYSDTAREELYEALYSVLVNREQFSEAAQLCSQLDWHEKAINCWVEAHNWSQAVYLCHAYHLTHLIDAVVKPALMDSHSHTFADLRAKREDLDKYSSRLVIVRQKKSNMDIDFDAMSDIQSDTSSLSSFTTSSAGSRTTKNTRKAQRKLWSLKEGNPREEQALLYTISELIQNTEKLTGEVHSTCLALAEFGLDAEASSLHSAMGVSLERIQQTKLTVWPGSCIKKTGSDADAIDPTSIDTQLGFPPSSNVSPTWKLNIYS